MPAAVPKCTPDEFQRLTKGFQVEYLAEVLAVSPTMIRKYRAQGAPEYRIQPLRQLISDRWKEAGSPSA